MRTRTLTQLIADVRAAIDAEGQSTTTGRHTDAAITRAVNQAQQVLRHRVSVAGGEYYLSTAEGTVAAGSVSWTPTPPEPSDVAAVYGVRVSGGGVTWMLQPMSWEQASAADAAGRMGRTGRPWGYRVVSLGQQAGGTAGIALGPAADQAYDVAVIYLPVAADLVAGSDELEGVAGWEDAVVYEAAARLVARDKNAAGQYPLMVSLRDEAWARIEAAIPRTSRQGLQRVDSRGLTRIAGARTDASVWGWYGGGL